MVESILFIFLITFVTSAVCQRWQKLLEGVGFISLDWDGRGSFTALREHRHGDRHAARRLRAVHA